MEAHGTGRGGDEATAALQRAPLSPEQAFRMIRKLEQEMHRLARNLEFEQAARVRDEISALRRASLGPEAERIAG
jgi:excinuclease ABC subunit B